MKRTVRGFASILGLVLIGIVLIGSAFAALLYFQISRDLPTIQTVEDYKPPGITIVEGVDGTLGEFYKERREVVPYEKMPKRMIEAFLSAEDDEFFRHGGINFQAILRASIANFLAGQVVQGGSTITQQLAKSLYLTPDRNLIRKAKEAILAYRLEKHLGKEHILYLYLNQIYLGNGAYGIQAASRSFFRKDVQNLSIAEMALLAGMPRAPTKYNPLTNPKRAKERQLYVLKRMSENGYIPPEQAKAEGKRPLKIFPSLLETPSASQFYLEHVRKLLVQKYGEKAVYEEGLRVRTPASLRILAVAHRALVSGLAQVERKKGYRGPLRHIEAIPDRAKFLLEEQLKMERRRTSYSTLTPGGEISEEDARKEGAVSSPEKILQVGETYEALVESSPDSSKPIEVAIGKAHAKILWSELAWTGAKSASILVKSGDVVRARILRVSNDKEGTLASLEPTLEVQGAVISMSARTGHVMSMVGGSDFSKSEFNRAVQAKRQAGSLIKPLLYSLAIERGFTPATILVDSPLVFDNEESGIWKPSNYEQKFFGDTTLWQALVNSRNVPTVKLVQMLGVEEAAKFLRRLRFTGDIPSDLSISLGSPNLTLEELSRAYALFPRGGKAIEPVYILEVRDRTGKLIQESASPVVAAQATAPASPTGSPAPPTAIAGKAASEIPFGPDGTDPDQLLDPRVAGLMANLLHDVVQYGTATRARELGRWIGGKTGTSNEFRDAWFIGFTPSFVSGVWVGHDDFKTLGNGEAGAAAALPIWIDTMKEVLAGTPVEEFESPPGVVYASVHPKTGTLVEAKSSQGVRMPFIEGTEPTTAAPNGRANPSTSSGSDFLKDDLGE